MKKYFYSNGKEKQGPFSFEELKDKNIREETLIWFKGLENWKPAEEIKEIEEILELIPPPIITDSVLTNTKKNKTNEKIEELGNDTKIQNNERDENKATDSNNIVNSTPHPWRRLFARTLDFYFGGFLVLSPLLYVIIYFSPFDPDGFIELIRNPIILTIILYLMWMPVEALLISISGTTISKWFFGIRVISKTGKKLTYANALKRVFHVFVQGEGFAFPIVILFTRYNAYKLLKKTGTTLWDRDVDSIVIYKKFGIFRIIASILLILLLLVIMTILNSLQ